MYWSPELTADFIVALRPLLDAAGLNDVGVTPGECTNWYRFSHWGYAYALADNDLALERLGLITSHGFYSGEYGRWFGEHASLGTDSIREKRPLMGAWVTSTSWGKMDANNLKEMHGNIYTAKVNGIIPWAGIQCPGRWVGGDPNPGCAIRIQEDGKVEIQRGYYYYKQICRAGQPGMAVARTFSLDSESVLIGFASNGTKNSDAFVVINIGKEKNEVAIAVKGSVNAEFEAFRTSDDKDRFKAVGRYAVKDGVLIMDAPARSATTFFGR